MNESVYVADTMALVLRLEKRRMPQRARLIFEQAEQQLATIHVPGMVLAEVGYLAEKERIDTTLADVKAYLAQFSGIVEFPMRLEVVERAFEITDIPELHDRLIAGTARFLDCKVISNDPKIMASAFVRTVWS